MPTFRHVWSNALLVSAALGLSSLNSALASPASDLFERASSLFIQDYYGWSTLSRPELVGRYRAALQQQCAPDVQACSFETGQAVLKQMFDEFHDDHTSVRDAEGALRLREVQQDLSVQRSGARVVKQPAGLLVVGVQPASPAERQGLKLYDLITTVNGQPAGSDQAVDAAAFVRLERTGGLLRLTVQRPGEAGAAPVSLPISVLPEVTQARDVPTLTWPSPGAALISVPTFLSGDSADLFASKVAQAQQAGARALIIDLRYNGGGRLDQCVAAASTFDPVIYHSRFQGGGSWTFAGLDGKLALPLSARLNPSSRLWRGPVALLVGSATASCAEVFSFFAQKSGAKVVGEMTKGVGNSGVNFYPLPGGGVLSLTMLRAYDAQGAPLPSRIQPDIVAPSNLSALLSGDDTMLDAALQALGLPLAAPSAESK